MIRIMIDPRYVKSIKTLKARNIVSTWESGWFNVAVQPLMNTSDTGLGDKEISDTHVGIR